MRGKAVATVSATGLAGICIALVTVWALADPRRDPVGDALADIAGRIEALRDWYGTGPLDARKDWDAIFLSIPNGDPARGRVLIAQYGCGACHVVPGVAGARGTVGPPLADIADRAYIAGVMTNSPDGLTRWLMNPPLFSWETAMPDLGVTEADAADMAAYLYSLGPAS